jgi:sphingosine kinase
MAFFQQEIAEGEKEPMPNAPFKLIRYGFEALMWGIIADVDIESEKYRWMGSARFTVATIPRILNPRYYSGKFLYLPSSEKAKTEYDVCQLPEAPCSTCLSHDDRHDMLDSLSPGTSKKHKKAQKLYKGRAAGLERSASLTFCPKDLTDPTADMPEDWKCIDGPFVYFVAANITHISNDVLSTPFAHCSDGAIDVAITRTFNDRTKMLSIFATELESGKYVRHDMMEYVKARAFILIPEGTKKGIMDVDGEPFPGAPIAVETHRGVLSFCCANWAPSIASVDTTQPSSPPPRESGKKRKGIPE